MPRNLVISIIILAGVAAAAVFLVNRPRSDVSTNPPNGEETEILVYTDDPSGISFAYPKDWGEPEELPGNSTCPEEDTYRTQDTLHVFDRELRFPDQDLPGSDSIIRSGIRFYILNTEKPGDCDSEILIRIAKGVITGEEISSVKLTKVNIPRFSYGIYNEQASRLDTEGRIQYTLFLESYQGEFLLLQPYMSFIPFADSPEWAEIDAKYPMNMTKYINEGQTAAPIRKFREEFKRMVEEMPAQ